VVAICEGGQARLAGCIETSREQLELLAASLAATDRVVLEATGPAFAIARILAPHVAEVVVANASEVRAISHVRVKSDNFDARTLARLLWAGMLVSVWVPDAQIGALRRRVARRAALVRQCTRAKNEIHAALARCLLGKAPVSDLFGKRGRAWLAEQPLPADEAETVTGGPDPDRLLRAADRRDRPPAGRVRRRLRRGQAADDDPWDWRGQRGHADRRDRRYLAF